MLPMPLGNPGPPPELRGVWCGAGQLLILSKGAVAIVKDATEIAKVTEPGAVFGELSAC